MIRIRNLAPAVLFFATVATGCNLNRGASPLALNEKIVATNKTLEEAGRECGSAVAAAARSNAPHDMARVRQAIANAKAKLQTALAEVPAVEVPSRQSAKDFQKAEIKFLQGQSRLFDADFGQIVSVLENQQLTSAEKAQQLQQIIQRAKATEDAALVELRGAQQQFARDHNITLR
jgi:hypothetical protein